MVTYGTLNIPSDEITVSASSTVQIGLAFDRTLGLVGGMDTSSGSASTGTVEEVSNPSDAANLFGTDSELHNATQIALQRDIDTLWAVGLSETTVTDEQQSTQSGSLDNSPIFDPNLHGEHSITVEDTGGTNPSVNIVYDSPPVQPTETDTVAINPHSGEYAADATPDGSNYEFDYVYSGGYTSAIDEILTEDPRVVAVGTETESHGSDLASDMETEAGNFVFEQGVIGAVPRQDANDASTYASNHSDSLDHKRLSVVASPRGYTDTDETEEERTCWGVAASFAEAPLGLNTTNNELAEYEALRTDLGSSDAQTFIDSQVLPLIDYPPVTIVKDQTTSTTTRFERVFSNQIVDEATARIHERSKQFVGSLNTESNRHSFERSLRNEMLDLESNVPSLLDAFAVNVTPDSSDDTQVDVEIGLDVVDSADTVDVELAVGDVIQNNT